MKRFHFALLFLLLPMPSLAAPAKTLGALMGITGTVQILRNSSAPETVKSVPPGGIVLNSGDKVIVKDSSTASLHVSGKDLLLSEKSAAIMQQDQSGKVAEASSFVANREVKVIVEQGSVSIAPAPNGVPAPLTIVTPQGQVTPASDARGMVTVSQLKTEVYNIQGMSAQPSSAAGSGVIQVPIGNVVSLSKSESGVVSVSPPRTIPPNATLISGMVLSMPPARSQLFDPPVLDEPVRSPGAVQGQSGPLIRDPILSQPLMGSNSPAFFEPKMNEIPGVGPLRPVVEVPRNEGVPNVTTFSGSDGVLRINIKTN